MKKLFVVYLMISPVLACNDEEPIMRENPADMPYEVVIDPANFRDTAIVGNDYFPISPGKIFVYEGKDEDGATIRVEEEHTMDTKMIMGVKCVVVRAREFEDDELIEDTFDWYAQDLEGNVWYFGEDSKEIEEGEVVSNEGSWESGVDGALPGIIMFANPIPGMWYRQEYYKGEAEDVGQVLTLNETITVPYGEFTGCLKTAEWNLLEPGVLEHKIYASGVGLVKALAVKGEVGYEDLIEIQE